ncbi:MAG: SIR2 family protein [Desulfobulbaceae bacterium]|nr:SIR2 family protein [Desulfobulbaceae bacterium]
MDLPKILLDQIREGQVVLFLGSGASKGASHPKNFSPPDGRQLGELIADKFLVKGFSDRPLDQIAEIAISETDLFTVQDYIHSIFNEFTPADFHKIISNFSWSAIATTNYDLILERAYNDAIEKQQNPVAFTKNGERVEEKLKAPNSVVYIKLHGCITNINDINIPLILTPEQYITHRKGRSRLFERLKSLAYEYPILFVGYTLSDPDIRAIMLELNELGEAKPRSYLLAPKVTDPDKRFWESRKITCIESTFKDFLETIHREIPKTARSLSSSITQLEHPLFSRLKISDKIKPSESLKTFISRDTEYIHKSLKTEEIDPKSFYKGFFVDWSPIISNLDVKRSISDAIMSEVVLATEEEKQEKVEFYLIKGHAGSGKSVICKRLAWDAATEFDKLCLMLNFSSSPDYEALAELSRLYGERIFLFIDPVSEFIDVVESFIVRARKDNLPLTIIAAERDNEWNTNCDSLKGFLTDNYSIRYLSEKELEELIHLLSQHKSLGHLEGKLLQEQKNALAQRAGRQLLVALHEATLGKPFSDIVFDEYESIASPKAQSLYLTVCIMHRLGVPSRAGLISRVHGIPFRQFKEELFDPLESVVFAKKDELINDYVYLSRHPRIAEMVFERVLINSQDRFDEYIRILNEIDIDYKSDFEAFKGLSNARQLLDLFSDPQMIRQIYEAAHNRIGDNALLLQQEALFEMHSTGGSLDKATVLLQRAHKIAPYNKAISHSLSELALRKADNTNKQVEKQKYRKESRAISLELLRSDEIVGGHAYHTIIKIGLDELNDLLNDQIQDEKAIGDKIVEIERNINDALQRFPKESFLLDADSRLQELINDYPAAIKSLEKAHSINKRSPYVALRLSKFFELNNASDKAINVLKQCLDANPAEKNVNYRLSYLLQRQPDADVQEVKHYLRRAFTKGDTNFAAQFWYARLLYLEGEHPEAMDMFRELSRKNIDIKIKREPRGIVKQGNKQIKFAGLITRLESSYCFIVRDKFKDQIFSHIYYTPKKTWNELSTYRRVTFELGFNYRGPFAVNLESE